MSADYDTKDFVVGERVRWISYYDNAGVAQYAEGTVVAIYHTVGTVDTSSVLGRTGHRPWDLTKVEA